MSSKQPTLLAQLQSEQLELAQKHEEETLRLAEEANQKQLWLAREQKFELQKRNLQTVESLAEVNRGESSKEDLENCQNTINVLTVAVNKANAELSEARKLAAELVQAVNTGEAQWLVGGARQRKGLAKLTARPTIGFKMVGSINEAPWAEVFKKRHRVDWDLLMTAELSKWEEKIRDPNFQPFKNVRTGNDQWKQEIDGEDEQLCSLKKKYGVRVYRTVTTALMELEENNSSGRYPVPYAWNSKESRIAKLNEVFLHLAPIIETFVQNKSPQVDASLFKARHFTMSPDRDELLNGFNSDGSDDRSSWARPSVAE